MALVCLLSHGFWVLHLALFKARQAQQVASPWSIPSLHSSSSRRPTLLEPAYQHSYAVMLLQLLHYVAEVALTSQPHSSLLRQVQPVECWAQA
jgi:hypothetical protein